jgi:hypothetical protein
MTEQEKEIIREAINHRPDNGPAMNEERPAYYAIIPANVRYDKNLNAFTRLLYGEITALCNLKGYCWSMNSYFARLYATSDRSISRWLSQLLQGGYIHYRWVAKNGGRCRQICLGPPAKNGGHNITSNITSNKYSATDTPGPSFGDLFRAIGANPPEGDE